MEDHVLIGITPGGGDCCTLKVGKVNVEGIVPVVKSCGADPVTVAAHIPHLIGGAGQHARHEEVCALPRRGRKRVGVFPRIVRQARHTELDELRPCRGGWRAVQGHEGGLAVGVMTACDPLTRDATASTAKAEVVSVAGIPVLGDDLDVVGPFLHRVHVKVFAGLKSRRTCSVPPWGAALNW
jgi:hypothetical protein